MQPTCTVRARPDGRQYNPVDGDPRKHRPRRRADVQGAEHRSLRGRHGGGGGRSRSSPGGYVIGRSTPIAVTVLCARRRLGLVPAPQQPAAGPVPRRSRRLRGVHGVERRLGAVVVRPRPHVGLLQPDGVLPRRGGGPRPHLGPRPAAADGRLRLPGRGHGRRRVRLPRQGDPGRGDSRAHLRPAGQSRRLLERARAHDGDGSLRRARRRRRPAHPPWSEDARRGARRCRCASPSSSPSPAAAGSRSSWRWCCTSASRPRGSPASSVSPRSSRRSRWSCGGCAAWGRSSPRPPTTRSAPRRATELLRWSIAALLVTAGVQLALALAQGAVRWPRWSTVAAGAAVLAVIAVVAVGGSARFLEAAAAGPRGSRTGSMRSPTTRTRAASATGRRA